MNAGGFIPIPPMSTLVCLYRVFNGPTDTDVVVRVVVLCNGSAE